MSFDKKELQQVLESHIIKKITNELNDDSTDSSEEEEEVRRQKKTRNKQIRFINLIGLIALYDRTNFELKKHRFFYF